MLRWDLCTDISSRGIAIGAKAFCLFAYIWTWKKKFSNESYKKNYKSFQLKTVVCH